MTDYSQVDILASRYKFVKFGVQTSPGSPNRVAQIDCSLCFSTAVQGALPTETTVESGTSQSKSGTSVNLSNSGIPVVGRSEPRRPRDVGESRSRDRSAATSTLPPRILQRDWYCTAEQPATAPHLAHPEGCAALRIVLVTVPRVGHSCEHFPDGCDLHLLQGCFTVSQLDSKLPG